MSCRPGTTHSPSVTLPLGRAVRNACRDTQEDERITEFGCQAFHALFRQDPTLLQLFPFRDSTGRPDEAELREHAKKVVRAFTTILEGLNDLEGTARTLKGIVLCAATLSTSSPLPAHTCRPAGSC